VEVSARARATGGSAFVSLRAVDENYPLLGAVTLAGPDGATLPERLAEQHGRPGAVAAPLLFDRLGLEPGDSIEIGAASFELRARLVGLPAQVTQGFQLGVPVLVSDAG